MDYYEYRIVLPDEFRQPLITALVTAGALGAAEEVDHILVYFPSSVPRRFVRAQIDVFRELLTRSGQSAPLMVEETSVVDQDWNAAWKKNFRPLEIGERFIILPPWEQQTGDRIPLVIDPGMAFGTGHHETTRSCLVLMERHAPRGAKDRFLDIGTGTGLLAIAALKMGFHHVEAIDHDDLAVTAARRNLLLNCAETVDLRFGDIASAGEGYAMITANLISGTLVALASEIARRLAHHGVAILSGILQGQEDDVILSMEQAGLVHSERIIDDKWVSVVVRRT